MTRHLTFIVRLIATLCTTMAVAVAASGKTDAAIQDSTHSLPVSYVYVSGGTVNNSEIYAYGAASDGRLTPVSGSPFRAFANYGVAVKGKYLFGTDGVYIYSFAIASDGAIKQVATLNAQQYNEPNYIGGPAALFLDRTEATLYDFDYDGYNATNGDYQSFGIDDSTGELTYLGVSSSSNWFYNPLTFVGNNVYAYGADCIADLYWTIFGFQRNSDGTLTGLNINPEPPKAKYGDFYCPNLTTSDKTNHVAISMQAVNQNFQPDGLPQLAAYAADTSGNLTTKNTRFNMPHTGNQGYSRYADVYVGQAPCGWRSVGIASISFQRRCTDHALYRTAYQRPGRSDLLGQRQSPVCHQPVRRQGVHIHDYSDERQPSPWLAAQDNQTAEYRRSV
ncbi:MAG TPA: hypothetical protein VN948_13665 [Terriglobales bacterium]|nr:hypothetical protein [Terriglobales bacterium]